MEASNTQETPASAQEIHETLYDGADIPVSYNTGRAGAVKVRKIPRNELASLSVIIGDDTEEGEFEEAALYCGRDTAWARSLDEASLDRVLEEGQRLNFSSFARWFRRRVRMVELANDRTTLMRAAEEALNRLERRASMSGSSPRATGTPTCGVTPPRS